MWFSSKYVLCCVDSNSDCYWLVLAPISQIVMLEVVDLDLPSCQDSAVQLYDGEYDSTAVSLGFLWSPAIDVSLTNDFIHVMVNLTVHVMVGWQYVVHILT